jgi:hypothetical protein
MFMPSFSQIQIQVNETNLGIWTNHTHEHIHFKHNITFMGIKFHNHQWIKAKKAVVCTGLHGSWVNVTTPTINNTQACIRYFPDSPYHGGNCLSAKDSKGKFYC